MLGLVAGAGIVGAVPALVLGAPAALAQEVDLPEAQPTIQPRAAWAAGIADVPGLPVEAPGDVRVLLVHHTATANEYGADTVPHTIQAMHRYHTQEKGWPDVAYNFFVDRYGGVWEGRTGSLASPVIADATGGNQGYSQLCCFLGDHTVEPPTPEAQRSMLGLLAVLAARYGVSVGPGEGTSFVSRGSNRWPAGATVSCATIEGHRAMSQTVCPGDAAYALVRDPFPTQVRSLVEQWAPPTTTTTTTAPSTTSTTAASAGSSSTAAPTQPSATPASGGDDGSDGRRYVPVGLGSAAAVVGGVLWWRHRRATGAAAADPGPPEAGASEGTADDL